MFCVEYKYTADDLGWSCYNNTYDTQAEAEAGAAWVLANGYYFLDGTQTSIHSTQIIEEPS